MKGGETDYSPKVITSQCRESERSGSVSERPRGFTRWKRNRCGCCAQEGGDALGPEESAPLLFSVKRQTLPSVGRSVSVLSNTGCARPQLVAVPAQIERV